jgi:hypothetical protein
LTLPGMSLTWSMHRPWHGTDVISLHCTLLYCTLLYSTVLHSTVLYSTGLYCTLLYCTLLYSTAEWARLVLLSSEEGAECFMTRLNGIELALFIDGSDGH